MDSYEVDELIEALKNANPSVRYDAALTLEAIGIPAVANLIKTLKHANKEDRFAANYILRKIGNSDTLPRMILATAQFTAHERIELLEALRKVRYKDRFIDSASGYSFPDTRTLCQTVLGEEDENARIGARTVLNWLIADSMLLLPSHPEDANSQELLRAAQGDTAEIQPETLVRGASKPEEDMG